MLMTIIAVTNQKGGVGKTTSTINLGYALADRGKRVLMVDTDPQASLTFYYNTNIPDLEAQRKTLYYALVEDRPLAELVIPGNPALIPSSITLAKADRELMSMMRYTATLLQEKLRTVAAEYDFALIDCPPTLSILTSNALAAADLVLIPVKTDLLSIMGIPLLLEEIEYIRERDNRKLKVFGILPTIHNAYYKQDQEAVDALTAITEQQETRIFKPIPRSTSFDRAPAEGKPVVVLTPKAPGAESYYELADQLIHHEY